LLFDNPVRTPQREWLEPGDSGSWLKAHGSQLKKRKLPDEPSRFGVPHK
jgi:hypothetical protein